MMTKKQIQKKLRHKL